MQIQSYLCFNGRCDEAIEHYRQALGAEVEFLMRYDEAPEPCPADMIPANWGNKVLHTTLRIGETPVMMSDGNSTEPAQFAGISLTALVKDETQADRVFTALGEGGSVCMPLAKTFFSPRFGMVNDKFGVSWMVIVPQEM